MKMETASDAFVVVIRRASGQAMEACPAGTLDEARRHAQGIFQHDPAALSVAVLEKRTLAPLGNVDREDGQWCPAEAFPLRRMTWH